MWITSRALLFALLALTAFGARADGIYNPAAGGNGNWVGWGTPGPNGIDNLGIGGSAVPVTPCTPGQFDFTNNCNAVFYVTIMR
jgi:hypothetical protein